MNSVGSINLSYFIVTIISLGTFFFIGNIIPIEAVKKEGTLLKDYDDLQEFADSVKDGDEEIAIPLEWMISADIYDHTDESLQDCIDLAAKVGDNLADKEVVQCIEDVNFFKNKHSPNSSVPIITISTTTTVTSAATGTNGISTSTSNDISTTDADDEENNLINELVKTGKFTEDEAKELVTKVMLINELVKTGKFTEDEAKELVTKVMKNGTDEANVTDGLNVPEANLTANVPEANLTANVPEANLTANVPEANLTANVPEANLTANVPETNASLNVPETNASLNVPETNATQGESTRKIALNLIVAKDPITRGDSQIVTAVASDSATDKVLDHVFIRLTVKDPIGIIVKNYTATEGNLTRSFTIGENAVGKFRILATASQTGVEIRKSSTFQVQ
jgi:polyhydroxyalkanoate synthesis regulator phasin